MYRPPRTFPFLKRKKKRVSGTYYGNTTGSKNLGAIRMWLSEINWLKAIAIAIFAGILFIASLFAWFSRDLPNPYKINNRPVAQSSKIVDRNGKLLYEIHGEENRTLVKFEDIPDNVKMATIALEDQDFYKHSGIDFKGIVRGVVLKPLTGQRAQGGSTITQQYVKNALLTSERSLTRKIKEFILSVSLEKIYSKNEILTLYLNEIPYGNNAYGIEAAAKAYFDKSTKDLTLAEAALLASVPQAPTYYNPYGSNTDALMARKNFTLDQMAKLNLIKKEEAEAAKSEVLKFTEKDEGILAPHFVMYVREQLAEKYGEQKLQEGGFVVTTTLDLDKQQMAEESVEAARASINALGAKNASLVSMDPKTGEILAMVGSVDYFDKENDGNVNVSIRPRQPGSSLKPIIYAKLFEDGYAPSTMLMDVPTDFGNYKPENYDRGYRGPVSVRRALQNSLNIPAVQALALVGVHEATDLANRMGLYSLTDPDRYGLSLVLGGGDVKLIESVNAYSVFAHNGIHNDPIAILKITEASGKVLEEFKPDELKNTRVLDETVTFLTSNVLADDQSRAEVFGIGGSLTLPGRPVAAKTGTTDEYRDAWTIGYTPSVVTGVWVGNNDNSPMARGGGAMAAAPIWNSYMRKVLAGTPVEYFTPPAGIVTARVDALTGMLPLPEIPEEIKDKLPTVEAYFIKGKEPTQTDTVHKLFKIVKGTTKLAGDACPDDATEWGIFAEYHSIAPGFRNWEEATVNWAKAAGFNTVPTETDNCEDIAKDRPQVTITTPDTEISSNGIVRATIATAGPKEIMLAEYYINGEKIAEIATSPFSLETFTLPTGTKGTLTLRVEVTDSAGQKGSTEKQFTVK